MTLVIVLRRVAHLARALKFMCDNGVLNGDLHARNVFVHFPPGSRTPDFYIGDFGFASTSGWHSYFASDIGKLRSLAYGLHLESDTMPVYEELKRLTENVEGNVGFPDLSRSLALVDKATEERPVMESCLGLYDSGPLDVVQRHHPNAESVVSAPKSFIGPYQVGEVKVDAAGNF